MLKPESFSEAQVTLRNTPYEFLIEDASAPGKQRPGGVLPRGHLVWSREQDPGRRINTQHSRTSVFVEHLGIISLDPQTLMRVSPLCQEWETHT